MLPHDVLRAAAKLIRERGHAQGGHAKDALGNDVPLFGDLRGSGEVDTSRANLNGAAVALSMYGAVVSILHGNPSNPTVIWTTLANEANRYLVGRGVPGGTNHLHPLVLLNEHMDTDQETAAAFLDHCAALLEPASKSVLGDALEAPQ